MRRLFKLVVLMVLATGLIVAPLAHAGSNTTNGYFYKPSYNEKGPVGYTLYNAALDATDAIIHAAYTGIVALNTLITNWVTVENIPVKIPGTLAYASGTQFTVTGDRTAYLPASATVILDLGTDGVKFNSVASSSFGAGVTTVNLNTSNLTSNLANVMAIASRNGLWPWGDGRIFGRDYGVPGQAALDAALAAVGVLERTLALYPGTWSITADTVIPANVTLKLERGAILSIATTKTLTINGTLDAGLYQIFSCTGSGKVDLSGVKGMAPVPVEWWGAVGDGATDCYAAIAKARDSKANLKFGVGDYWTSDSIGLYSGQCIYGDGYNSRLTGTHATGGYGGAVLDIAGGGAVTPRGPESGGATYCDYNIVHGVHFVGQGVSNENGIGMTWARYYDIDNVYFTNIGQHAITAQESVQYGHVGTAVVITSDIYAAGNRAPFQLYGLAVGSGGTGTDTIGNIWENLIALNQPYIVLDLNYCYGNKIGSVYGVGGYTNLGVYIHAGAKKNTIGTIQLSGTCGSDANSIALGISGSGTSYNVVNEIIALPIVTGILVSFPSLADFNTVNIVRGNATASILNIASPDNIVKDVIGSTSGSYSVYIDAARNQILSGNVTSTYVGTSYANLTTLANDCLFQNVQITGSTFYVQGLRNRILNNVSSGAIAVDGGQLIYTNNSWQPNTTAVPSTGTWRMAQTVNNSAPTTGQPFGWVCQTSGTFEDVGPLAGTTTSGSAVVTMASTTGLYAGQFVTFSAGFATLTPREILSVVPNTSITIVGTVANASGAANISTVDPTFKVMANIP